MKHFRIVLGALIVVVVMATFSACGSYFSQTELEAACAQHNGVRSAYALRGRDDIAICMDGTLVSSD